jgi:hypothetical protein
MPPRTLQLSQQVIASPRVDAGSALNLVSSGMFQLETSLAAFTTSYALDQEKLNDTLGALVLAVQANNKLLNTVISRLPGGDPVTEAEADFRVNQKN